ncbi:MAG: hypothetical protein M0R03_04945 [Novosphingobium sp.]|nr:hypothetical protein [Novosphingobium sp.]
MGLLRMAAIGAAGYGIYKYFQREQEESHVAFAEGETAYGGAPNQVRNAGPEAMRSDPPAWDRTDEASDESFPASDPPGTY